MLLDDFEFSLRASQHSVEPELMEAPKTGPLSPECVNGADI